MNATALKMFSETVKYENNYIWVKPVCDFFQLHDKNQYQKIKKDLILGNLVGKNRPDSGENKNLGDGNRPDLGKIDANGRIFLSRKGFVRWIQIINANTVDENLRDLFVTYQAFIFDFLYGSAEENDRTKASYLRLQKLERLKDKINNEIKREKSKVGKYLQARFQTQLEFPN